MVFVAALSFGNSRWMAFPPPSWTFRWYGQLFANEAWLAAFWASLRIGVYVVVCCMALAVPASFGLVRSRFLGKAAVDTFLSSPLFVPVIIIAIALYILMLNLGLVGSEVAFVIAHTVVALPFAMLMVTNALKGFDESIEKAAMICGASRLRAIMLVTLPSISQGLFSGALFAFVISWDEVVLSMFMAGPRMQTLPVKMWSMVRADISPEIAAVATIMLASTTILVTIAYALMPSARRAL
ncbi:MAG: ABC transporter permease [Pseudomonadota bacterium]